MAQFIGDSQDTLDGSFNNRYISIVCPLHTQLLLGSSVALPGYSTEYYEHEPMQTNLSYPDTTRDYGVLQCVFVFLYLGTFFFHVYNS